MVRLLIIANVLVFLLQLGAADALVGDFALWPPGRHAIPELGRTVGFEPWQLVTSSFLHGGLAHLGLNMFALWMFGRDVERVLGSFRFAQLYFTSVLVAGLTQLVVVSSFSGGQPYPTVGASGGVFGLLLAFGMMFPYRTLVLLFPPIPMPAWVFVTLYGVVELANGVFGTAAGVAHFAHLGGMLGAFLLLQRWRR
jgi:membrane associated rhomboid family serine protease